ncbi:hypothetical protein H6P81_004640 [Aristolochia fimbriata]|uniref:Protein CLP1 homolog n=1 Tax=Aristolochia fimbriata TaxID=158543 RepID=A0AAV7EV79_ARIFI|nr:hypothetical protein H6P81_004640 [Aristolochia fimbriata]
MASASPSRQFKLAKESELRIEVGEETSLRLRLLAGTAEIFGTELPPENWLDFPPRLKFAIFTWNGATIEVNGTSEVEYVADETPMVSYVNVHAILDARRARARGSTSDKDSSQGPRVIVVGPTDSGKSSLSRMLLSWAAKQNWKPTFVDLDIGQGSITTPGCIAATPIEMPIDPVEGIPLEMPIVHFFGHVTPSANTELYKVLVTELARTLERQFAGNAESRAAGMVINTMGWVEGVGYELLLHSIHALNADVVLVLGQEKLYSMLKDVLKGKPNVDVVKLHKSGGVVSRNPKVRQKARSFRIREYFYGLVNDLSPHSHTANFSDLFVYRIGGGPQAPRSALPIGAEPAADPTRLVHVNINHDLLRSILAVSYAKEPEQIISSNVAGFIYVTEIDVQRKKIQFLAPCLGELPSKEEGVGTMEGAREMRRKRIAERGADRLAFITGQRDALAHSQSLPKVPAHVPAVVNSSGEDDSPSTSVAPKAEKSNDTVWQPTGLTTGIHLHHRTSSLPVQPSYALSPPARVATDENPTDSPYVLQTSQAYYEHLNFSNKSRLGSYLAKTFSPNRLSLSISATESIRLVCAVIFALMVAVTSQRVADPLVPGSFLTRMPLVLLLLTDITIVLGLILVVERGRSEMTDEGKATGHEDDWAENVGKMLEVGLMVQKALNAAFMDCSVYAITLISALCLRYYIL